MVAAAQIDASELFSLLTCFPHRGTGILLGLSVSAASTDIAPACGIVRNKEIMHAKCLGKEASW
jgi:hypothetical protein